MKFIHYLETITGVGVFPLISLAIFFLYFTGMAIWAVKVNKTYIGAMKNLPFADNDNI